MTYNMKAVHLARIAMAFANLGTPSVPLITNAKEIRSQKWQRPVPYLSNNPPKSRAERRRKYNMKKGGRN